MARLGRAQPIKPHLPGPIVAPGGPVVPKATVVLWRDKERRARRGAPKPHVATAIVAPGGPVVPGATRVPQNAPRTRPNTGRRVLQPHLPGAVVAPGGPVVPGATIRLNDANRKGRTHLRGAPKPHLPGAVVAPGGPVVPGSTVVYATPPRRWKRNPAKPQVAGPVLTAPVAPLAGPGTFVYQALKRILTRREPPRAHLAKPVVAPGGPVVPGATVVTQTPPKRWKRNPAKPLLATPVVAPGGPVIPGQTILLNKENRVGRTNLRGAPKPHVAPPNLTPPPIVTPVGPGRFVYQALQRTRIGRRLLKALVAPPLVGPFVPPPLVIPVPIEFRAFPPRLYWSAADERTWWETGRPHTSRWEVGEASGAWSSTQAVLEPLEATEGSPFGAGLFGMGLFGEGIPQPTGNAADVDKPTKAWKTGGPRP